MRMCTRTHTCEEAEGEGGHIVPLGGEWGGAVPCDTHAGVMKDGGPDAPSSSCRCVRKQRERTGGWWHECTGVRRREHAHEWRRERTQEYGCVGVQEFGSVCGQEYDGESTQEDGGMSAQEQGGVSGQEDGGRHRLYTL